MDRFWVIWNENGRPPMYKHATLEGAKAEAERLTKLHGGAFHVLSLHSTCKKNDVVWEAAQCRPSAYDDSDPFADE